MNLLARHRRLLQRAEHAIRNGSRPGRVRRIECDCRALYRELEEEAERVRPEQPALALEYVNAADELRCLASATLAPEDSP